jgi:Protein of unknown function (DUF3775)
MRYFEDQKELVAKIGTLSEGARLALKALMWTGRDPDANFRAELVRAHQLSEGEEEDIRYLVEKASALPTYLRTGLEKLGLTLGEAT